MATCLEVQQSLMVTLPISLPMIVIASIDIISCIYTMTLVVKTCMAVKDEG